MQSGTEPRGAAKTTVRPKQAAPQDFIKGRIWAAQKLAPGHGHIIWTWLQLQRGGTNKWAAISTCCEQIWLESQGQGSGKKGWRPRIGKGAESWGNEVRRCAAKRSCHRPSTPCHTHKKDARTPNLGQNQLVSRVVMGRGRGGKELEEEGLALHQLAADWR